MNLATKSHSSPLVPSRECGSCSACCVSLRINTAMLRKPADIECVNLTPTNGCGIYGSRPPACRSFHCGWRMLEGLDDAWRPDRAKVMIRLEEEGLVLLALGSMKAVLGRPILKFIKTCLENGVTIFLSIPAKPGKSATKIPINELMPSASNARGLEAVIKQLIKAIELKGA